jgi:hypothetical protein
MLSLDCVPWFSGAVDMALSSVSWSRVKHLRGENTESLQWKTFDFFEVSQVNPPDDESKAFFENSEISCVCSGSENLFLGSYDGIVRILSPSFKVLRTFQAHDTGSITHMKQVEGTSLLVTIAVRILQLWVYRRWMVIGRHIQRASLESMGTG